MLVYSGKRISMVKQTKIQIKYQFLIRRWVLFLYSTDILDTKFAKVLDLYTRPYLLFVKSNVRDIVIILWRKREQHETYDMGFTHFLLWLDSNHRENKIIIQHENTYFRLYLHSSHPLPPPTSIPLFIRRNSFRLCKFEDPFVTQIEKFGTAKVFFGYFLCLSLIQFICGLSPPPPTEATIQVSYINSIPQIFSPRHW